MYVLVTNGVSEKYACPYTATYVPFGSPTFDAQTPYLPAPPPDATNPSPTDDAAFMAVRVPPKTSSL